jgi:hypothetical protein
MLGLHKSMRWIVVANVCYYDIINNELDNNMLDNSAPIKFPQRSSGSTSTPFSNHFNYFFKMLVAFVHPFSFTMNSNTFCFYIFYYFQLLPQVSNHLLHRDLIHYFGTFFNNFQFLQSIHLPPWIPCVKKLNNFVHLKKIRIFFISLCYIDIT